MQTFTKFLYEFLSQFAGGIITIVQGIWTGITQVFNIPAYGDVIQKYKTDLSMPEWLLVGVAVFMLLLVLGMAVLLILFIVRKYAKFRKNL